MTLEVRTGVCQKGVTCRVRPAEGVFVELGYLYPDVLGVFRGNTVDLAAFYELP